ncbi:unnamed protein product, partial [Discosporangium mesarthrocarpum]
GGCGIGPGTGSGSMGAGVAGGAGGARPEKDQLEGMAEAVIMALSFMPTDAAPLVVMVTDGVGAYPVSMRYDGLEMQLCQLDVPVTCLLFHPGRGLQGALGRGLVEDPVLE